MWCQSKCPQPPHHDNTEAEGSGLHSHLHTDRPAQSIEFPEHRCRPSQPHKSESITDKTATTKHNHRKDHDHHNAREQGTYTRTKQSHLRETQFSIDQNIVSYDVKRIPSKQNPHGRLGVGDAIRKLFKAVEQHDKNQWSKQH